MDKKTEEQIENLIDAWARDLDDAAFIEALEEMEDRARTAREARQSEIEDEENGDAQQAIEDADTGE